MGSGAFSVVQKAENIVQNIYIYIYYVDRKPKKLLQLNV